MESVSRKLRALTEDPSTTVRRVVNYLYYCFDSGEVEVAFNCGSSKIAITDLLLEYPTLGSRPASTIKIRFFGGPPGKAAFYSGTMLTLLEDTVMRCVAQGRYDLTSRFLNATL
jgi:hypothetical protein